MAVMAFGYDNVGYAITSETEDAHEVIAINVSHLPGVYYVAVSGAQGREHFYSRGGALAKRPGQITYEFRDGEIPAWPLS